MRTNVKTTVALAVVAGLLAASTATPAAADGWGRPAWGYGQGWGPHGGWGHRHRGWDNGGAAAAAALGGLALGVVAGAMIQPGDDYGRCYLVDRPVTDDWGEVVGYRQAQVCD